MTSKRCRIARSMSFSQLGLINQPSPQPERLWNPAISVDKKPVSGSEMAAAQPTFTVSSSTPEIETERESSQGQFGNLLERCYSCNQRMPHGTVVYMYGILHGFCSPECRLKQMVSDKVVVISQNPQEQKPKINLVLNQKSVQLTL